MGARVEMGGARVVVVMIRWRCEVVGWRCVCQSGLSSSVELIALL